MGAMTTYAQSADLLAADEKALTASSNALVAALEAIGWDLLSVEVDLVAETARIELRSGDLAVLFDARNGRASITRDRIVPQLHRIGRKGDITVVERLHPIFIGRQRCGGLRGGLRTLSHYVADNAPVAIGHDKARDIFRPLLNPALIGGDA